MKKWMLLLAIAMLSLAVLAGCNSGDVPVEGVQDDGEGIEETGNDGAEDEGAAEEEDAEEGADEQSEADDADAAEGEENSESAE